MYSKRKHIRVYCCWHLWQTGHLGMKTSTVHLHARANTVPANRHSADSVDVGICRTKDRHTSLALYILLRGATLIIRCGNKPDAPPAVRKALAPTRWAHGDTALMCLATSQICYSWIMMPHTLPSTYIRFLNKHGGRQQWHYNAARVSLHEPCLSTALES